MAQLNDLVVTGASRFLNDIKASEGMTVGSDSTIELGTNGDIILSNDTWDDVNTSLVTAVYNLYLSSCQWRSIPDSTIEVNGTIDLSDYINRTKYFAAAINAATPDSSHRCIIYIPAQPGLVSYYTFHDGASYGYLRIQIDNSNVLTLLSISKTGYKIEYMLH